MDVPLARLLVRPRDAFRSADEQLSLAQVFALVFVIGCVSLTTALPLYANMARQLPADIQTFEFVVGGQTAAVPTWFAVGLLVSVLIIILAWLVTAGIIHGAARIAGGDGRFKRLLVFVGWCHAPYLVVYPVIGAVTIWLLWTSPDATLSGVLHGTSSFGGESLATFNGEGLMDARSNLMWAVTVWIGYLWAGAIEVNYDLPRRRALAIAAVLAAVSIGLTYLPF